MITAEYLTAFNNELLHCYKAFKQLCEENNLQYFACGGTCIGAVRHNNIIPWDDDIDVLMPRDDYYKFLDLKSKLQGTGYDIISYRDSDYYFPFSKFINTNTTIWESRKRNRIIGAFIDVFPLYTTDLPDEQIITMQKQF
jgi:lipopolysaccharide cholinephosphotransferase